MYTNNQRYTIHNKKTQTNSNSKDTCYINMAFIMSDQNHFSHVEEYVGKKNWDHAIRRNIKSKGNHEK